MHVRDGVQVAPAGGRAAHVLARSLCRFRRYDLPAGLNEGQIAAYLKVQLLGWQPFAQSDAVARWQDGVAWVWAWDQAALLERCRSVGLPPPGRVYPETLACARPAPGLHLFEALEGVEGEWWDAQGLRASRWWMQTPGEGEWALFCRSCGQPPGPVPLPPRRRAALLDAGPALQRLSRPRLPLQRLAAGLLAAGLFILIAFSAALLRDYLSLRGETRELEARSQAVSEQAAGIVAAREQTLRLLPALQAFDQAVNPVPVLLLLGHLTEQLPSTGTRVEELQLQGRSLRLKLRMPAGASRAAFVSALENGGWLARLREQPEAGDPDVLVLVAEVGPRAPGPAPAAPPAAAPLPQAVPLPGDGAAEVIPLEPVNG
ncbi:MAG TPA: hypothetical protein VFV27_06345 [Nevskiaceae bacterium]|nr:hypothetical protein [Nevskiaceae bacterium]